MAKPKESQVSSDNCVPDVRNGAVQVKRSATMSMHPLPLIRACLTAIAGMTLCATGASAATMPATQVEDLNDATHLLPDGLSPGRTVLVFGFSHGASKAMDRCVQDLQLSDNADGWLELPIVGAVTPMVRPMIRGGMKGQYKTKLRRAHVAPVFEAGPGIIASIKPVKDDIVVIVVDRAGEIIARADGASTPESVGAISRNMREQSALR